jgi:hypothetical protein
MIEQHWGFFLVDGFFAFLLGAGLFFAARHLVKARTGPGSSRGKNSAHIELLLLYFLVPTVALLAASLLHPHIYIERSMLIVLPPFCILLAHGVMSLPQPGWRAVTVTALLAANFVALANLWVLKRDAWTVYKPNPDWQSFTRDLREDTKGTVVFTSCPPLALHYYLEGSGSIAVWLGRKSQADSRRTSEGVRRLLGQSGLRYPHFFYVAINRHWGDRHTSRLNEEVFAREYQLLEKNRYLALDVYKYGFRR